MGRKVAKGRKISDVQKMPTSVSWKYDRTDIRANVAYDIFTAKDANHVNSSGDFELVRIFRVHYIPFSCIRVSGASGAAGAPLPRHSRQRRPFPDTAVTNIHC